MAKLQFMNARLWRFMIESIEKVIAEGVFVLDKNGLKLRAIDPSKIMMVDLYYPKEAFSTYNIEEEATLAVNFEDIIRIFRRALKNDTLELDFNDSHIYISLQGKGIRNFKLPQIQLPYEKLPEPKVGFTVHAKMMSSIFSDIIRDIELTGSSVTFTAKQDKLYLSSLGDIEEAEVELSTEKQNLIELDVESEDSTSYSVIYLSNMVKAAKVAESVTIHYSEDAPLKADLEYIGGGRLTFYVSPLIT
ncbi:MAG: proliferating cell nuclear antigen (pcna) [Desulfurococcales archaeon]|nr:proliferating cell nuclear antigen (pcna) [Desulfurococcales archaeon]